MQNKPIAQLGIAPGRFAEMAKLIDANKISASSAGPIFDRMVVTDAPPEAIASELGLMQVSDTDAIDAAIDQMIASNPKPLADFKAGKQARWVRWSAW